MSKKKKCNVCEEKFKPDERHEKEDLIWCDDCFYEEFSFCYSCDNTERWDDICIVGDDTYCNTCTNEYFFKCNDCNEYRNNDYRNTGQYGSYFCDECIFNDHSTCDNCDEITHLENLYHNENEDCTLCNSCNNSFSIIKPYNYTPTPIFHASKNEPSYSRYNDTEKRLVFGFELEVENKGDYTNTHCAEKLKEIGKELIYFKEDSSINNGFEIVSHPMTYKYFKENKRLFNNILKTAIALGLRSYNTTTCGLHISICRKAFTHSHYLKFINFFNSTKNHNILRAISQRNESSLNRWCSLTKFSNKNELIKFSKVKNNGQSLDRYLALNIQNTERLEVRLFRGTLKLDSFLKGFECVFAIFDFCKQMSFSDLEISSKKTVNDIDEKVKNQNIETKGTSIAQIRPNLVQKRYFHTFVHKNKKQFKNLDLFLSEKYATFYNVDKSESKINDLNQILNQNKGGYYSCV